MDFQEEQQWLEPLLLDSIPMARYMTLRVGRLDADGIRLDFPLAPSVNDKGPAFGGALASAMILAGWSLPRLLLRREGLKAELVIGRCELSFLRPVHGPYQAACDWPEPAEQEALLAATAERGKGRLDLAIRATANGEVAASLSARYAALVTSSGP